MSIKEEEDQKMREKSAAYGLLMNQWAFKDHLDFLKELRAGLLKSLPLTSEQDITAQRFGVLVGGVQVLEKIEREIDYILNWSGS